MKDWGYNVPVLDDSFNPETLATMRRLITQDDNIVDKLQLCGRLLYENPFYTDSAGPGAYLVQAGGGGGGDSLEELSGKLDGFPPTEIMGGGGGRHKRGVKIKGPRPRAGAPRLVDDRPKKPRVRRAKRKSLPGLPKLSAEVAGLLAVSPALVQRFLETYAGAPKMLRRYSDEGDNFDLDLWILGVMEAFIHEKAVQSPASGHIGVSVDVSGSTQGQKFWAFVNMSHSFLSLFHLAALQNKKMGFSLAAFGTSAYVLHTVNKNRLAGEVRKSVAQLYQAQRVDRGGTSGRAFLDALDERYEGLPRNTKKIEIVFTDGGFQGMSTETMRAEIKDREAKYNVRVVFVGIETNSVEKFDRHLVLERIPTGDQLIRLVINLSLLQTQTREFPKGDLSSPLGLTPVAASIAQRLAAYLAALGKSAPPGSRREAWAARLERHTERIGLWGLVLEIPLLQMAALVMPTGPLILGLLAFSLAHGVLLVLEYRRLGRPPPPLRAIAATFLPLLYALPGLVELVGWVHLGVDALLLKTLSARSRGLADGRALRALSQNSAGLVNALLPPEGETRMSAQPRWSEGNPGTDFLRRVEDNLHGPLPAYREGFLAGLGIPPGQTPSWPDLQEKMLGLYRPSGRGEGPGEMGKSVLRIDVLGPRPRPDELKRYVDGISRVVRASQEGAGGAVPRVAILASSPAQRDHIKDAFGTRMNGLQDLVKIFDASQDVPSGLAEEFDAYARALPQETTRRLNVDPDVDLSGLTRFLPPSWRDLMPQATRAPLEAIILTTEIIALLAKQA